MIKSLKIYFSGIIWNILKVDKQDWMFLIYQKCFMIASCEPTLRVKKYLLGGKYRSYSRWTLCNMFLEAIKAELFFIQTIHSPNRYNIFEKNYQGIYIFSSNQRNFYFYTFDVYVLVTWIHSYSFRLISFHS